MKALVHPIEHCQTLADVRRNVDALDERITALMAERSGYMTQAARSRARALCSVSFHSSSGTESATTPAAACT